jgi:hypothetical protein
VPVGCDVRKQRQVGSAVLGEVKIWAVKADDGSEEFDHDVVSCLGGVGVVHSELVVVGV